MAIMIPNRPPDSNQSERQFWRELKEQLSDEFYVYHSLPYLRRDAKQGELDFLVVHRTHGMLNIECKGSGVDRGTDGQWYRTNLEGHKTRMRKSPTEQATTQIEHIVSGLRDPLQRALSHLNYRKFPLVYGWALTFPMTRADDLNLPLSLQPEVLIDSGDIHDDLEAAVLKAIHFHGRKLGGTERHLDLEDFALLRAIISPPMSIPKKVDAADLDRDKREILRLSNNQARSVRQMIANRRVRIPGGAGTGKTVLALHGARLLAEQGEDVLLTCFNSNLCEYLRSVTEEWPELPGTVDVHHFHGLCAIADEDLGHVLNYPERDAPRKERQKFWRDDTAFALMRAIDEDKLSLGLWDTVIVDEGQDFAAIWWEALRDCLRGDSEEEKGRMVIFYDEAQAIFDHEPCVPEAGYIHPLFDNFRNTRAISEAITQLVDTELEPHPDVPEGEPPKVYQQPGPTKTRRKVGELLDHLVDRHRIDYDRIVILTPHSPKSSSLEGATTLGEHPIVHKIDDWGQGVLHASIGSFKGLESDVVILVDIDPDDKRCSPNARYVAASRAAMRLYIFEKGHWLQR